MGKRFPAEVRARAVRLVEEHITTHGEGVTAACGLVAPRIGFSHHTLHAWVKQSRASMAPTGQMSREKLACEVKQLRAKLVEMERANEILKAASAFSQPSSTDPARDDPVH